MNRFTSFVAIGALSLTAGCVVPSPDYGSTGPSGPYQWKQGKWQLNDGKEPTATTTPTGPSLCTGWASCDGGKVDEHPPIYTEEEIEEHIERFRQEIDYDHPDHDPASLTPEEQRRHHPEWFAEHGGEDD